MKLPDYGFFIEYINIHGQNICLFIHPEMYPAKDGIAPTGKYFIFCIHPVHGSCYFIVEQNERYVWFSQNCPPFIDQNLIASIGDRIELKSKSI